MYVENLIDTVQQCSKVIEHRASKKIGVVVNHNGEPVQAINLCMCTNERCLSVTDNGLHNISSSFLIVFLHGQVEGRMDGCCNLLQHGCFVGQ